VTVAAAVVEDRVLLSDDAALEGKPDRPAELDALHGRRACTCERCGSGQHVGMLGRRTWRRARRCRSISVAPQCIAQNSSSTGRGDGSSAPAGGVSTVGGVEIYLDYNATTPVDPAVVDVILPYWGRDFGNAASTHPRGRRALAAVESARRTLANALGVEPTRVVWTSGSTEALNAALKGLAEKREGRDQLVVSATEHKAVLDVADWLAAARGIEVLRVGCDQSGIVDLDELETVVGPRVFAVAVMAANNETGVVNPVSEVAEVAHAIGAAYVCDATQVLGKLQTRLDSADFVAVSGHKVYGPQGVGALVVPKKSTRQRWDPLLHGGGHEYGHRSGTLNLPGIVGFAAAVQLAQELLPDETVRLAELRDRLVAGLESVGGGVTVNGQGAQRLPNTANVRIEGVDADAMIVNTPDVAFSSGSACTAAVPTPSHVLLAMGMTAEKAEQSIRLSVGRYTTQAEVDRAIELLAGSIARLRSLNGAA
jgi:cysteine desulfurase